MSDIVPSIDVSEITTVIAEFDKVANGIAQLREKHGGIVYEIQTTNGMEHAVQDRIAIRTPRYDIENRRKEAKKPILDLGRKLDARAAEITAQLLAIEEPITAQIDAENARKEAIRVEKARVEKIRVDALEKRLQAIVSFPLLLANKPSELIKRRVEAMRAIAIDDTWEEFKERAEQARTATIDMCEKMAANALERELEAERLKKQAEELEEQRKIAAEAQRIADEKAAAEKAARDKEAADHEAEMVEARAELARRMQAIEAREKAVITHGRVSSDSDVVVDLNAKPDTKTGEVHFTAHNTLKPTHPTGDQVAGFSNGNVIMEHDVELKALEPMRKTGEVILANEKPLAVELGEILSDIWDEVTLPDHLRARTDAAVSRWRTYYG